MNKKYIILGLAGGIATLVACCLLVILFFVLAAPQPGPLPDPDCQPGGAHPNAPECLPRGYTPTEAAWEPEPAPTAEAWEKSPAPTDYIPTGGIGNELLRRDVWTAILGVTDCQTVDASDVAIFAEDVEQGSGLAETWLLYCQEGGKEEYIVFYEELPGGGVEYVIGRVREE